MKYCVGDSVYSKVTKKGLMKSCHYSIDGISTKGELILSGMKDYFNPKYFELSYETLWNRKNNMKYLLIFNGLFGIRHEKEFRTIKDAKRYIEQIGYEYRLYEIVNIK